MSDITGTPLKVFFVLISVHKEKEWANYAGCLFAKDASSIQRLLDKNYGKGNVICRYYEEMNIEEGTILYGKAWRKL